MKVKGLDGRIYVWNLNGYQHSPNQTRPRSELHLIARKLLKSIYPSFSLLEELHLPGSDKLYVDFFIPQMMTAYEVQGRQHFEFVQHFHKNKLGFAKSKIRDKRKKEWLSINGIELIELIDNEVEQWRGKIIGNDSDL